MKRVLKWSGVALAALGAVAAAYALYIQIDGIPRYPVRKIDLRVEVTPERAARGKKFAGMLCSGCHMDPTTRLLTGHFMSDLPKQFGKAYSRNITRDPVHGIGAWTDGELAFLLRTGIHPKTGAYVPPWMPKLAKISDEDLFSIIAFLRSDDPSLRPSAAEMPPSQPSWLAKFLSHVAFKPFAYPERPIQGPPAGDKLALGRYLALHAVECWQCHSPDFKTINLDQPEETPGFLSGGNEMLDPNGKPILTPNLTADEETGIGKWTEAQFIRAMKAGFRPDDAPIKPPMQRYFELTDEEVSAIFAWLRTQPRIRHEVVQRNEYRLQGQAISEGQRIYYKYSCYSCHGEEGVGSCDLRQADSRYPDDAELIAWIRDPQKLLPDSKMPTWDGVIAESEYAPLARYVRLLGQRAAAKPVAASEPAR